MSRQTALREAGSGRLDANNTVTDFYTTGTVTSSTGIAGPLVGELQYGGNNITNTFWNGSSQGNPAGQTDTAGSLPGHANISRASPRHRWTIPCT